jgi:hypothetical protein
MSDHCSAKQGVPVPRQSLARWQAGRPHSAHMSRIFTIWRFRAASYASASLGRRSRSLRCLVTCQHSTVPASDHAPGFATAVRLRPSGFGAIAFASWRRQGVAGASQNASPGSPGKSALRAPAAAIFRSPGQASSLRSFWSLDPGLRRGFGPSGPRLSLNHRPGRRRTSGRRPVVVPTVLTGAPRPQACEPMGRRRSPLRPKVATGRRPLRARMATIIGAAREAGITFFSGCFRRGETGELSPFARPSPRARGEVGRVPCPRTRFLLCTPRGGGWRACRQRWKRLPERPPEGVAGVTIEAA